MSKEKKSIADEVEEEVRAYREAKKSPNSDSAMSELLQLFLGIVLLGIGLFMLSRKVLVQSSWFGWRLGGYQLSSGTITIPLLLGIIWYFFNQKSFGAKLLIILSVIFIIVSIIMSVRIQFVTTTMFDYVLMFGMMAAGAGLLLKVLFKKH